MEAALLCYKRSCLSCANHNKTDDLSPSTPIKVDFHYGHNIAWDEPGSHPKIVIRSSQSSLTISLHGGCLFILLFQEQLSRGRERQETEETVRGNRVDRMEREMQEAEVNSRQQLCFRNVVS